MNIPPTAEELTIKMFIKDENAYSSFNRVSFTGKQLKAVAIEFAKLHVLIALNVDKESILGAYAINNIK